MTRALFILAAILALAWLSHDPAEHLRPDIEYCDRIDAGAHNDYAPRDCEAIRAEYESLTNNSGARAAEE